MSEVVIERGFPDAARDAETQKCFGGQAKGDSPARRDFLTEGAGVFKPQPAA